MSNKPSLDLERFLPYVIVGFAGRLSSTLASQYQRQYEITIAEWRVMANLHTRGELMPKEIAKLTNMDKVKVSRALHTLEGKAWVKKKNSAADNRAYFVALTAKGKTVMAKMIPQVLDWQSALLKTVSPQELTVFLRTVAKLDKQLDTMTLKRD